MRPRDLETLYKQYAKLRNKLLKEEMSRFAYRDEETGKIVYDKAQVDDLKSYINYQFVKLTKEYDPNSGVDFPGYIKQKLTLRTRHSYIKKKYKHYYRTHDLNKDNNKLVESTLYMQSLDDWNVNQEDGILAKIEKADLEPIEQDIVEAWLEPPLVRTTNSPVYNSNRTVYQLLRDKYPEYTYPEFMAKIKEVRAKLKELLS